MRENPTPHIDPSQSTYAGDNFVRHSGDYKDFTQVQRFAWDAQRSGGTQGADVVPVANPSQAELLHKQFREKKATLEQRRRAEILRKYGGAEHLDAGGEAHEAQLGATEHYVEYDAEGRVIKGLEKAAARSKYDEDVYPSNHSSVWGSFWTDGQWGYACCHQLVRSAYCLGEAGKRAAADAAAAAASAGALGSTAAGGAGDGAAAGGAADGDGGEPLSLLQKMTQMSEKEHAKMEKARRKQAEKEAKKKKKEFAEALKHEERAAKRRAKGLGGEETDDRKRKYNSESGEVTTEQHEAYLQKRLLADDPMAKYVAEDNDDNNNDDDESESESGSYSYSDSESSSSERRRRRKRRKKKEKRKSKHSKKKKSKSSKKKKRRHS